MRDNKTIRFTPPPTGWREERIIGVRGTLTSQAFHEPLSNTPPGFGTDLWDPFGKWALAALSAGGLLGLLVGRALFLWYGRPKGLLPRGHTISFWAVFLRLFATAKARIT